MVTSLAVSNSNGLWRSLHFVGGEAGEEAEGQGYIEGTEHSVLLAFCTVFVFRWRLFLQHVQCDIILYIPF